MEDEYGLVQNQAHDRDVFVFAIKRAAYLKKHAILYHIGDNCMTMFRIIWAVLILRTMCSSEQIL